MNVVLHRFHLESCPQQYLYSSFKTVVVVFYDLSVFSAQTISLLQAKTGSKVKCIVCLTLTSSDDSSSDDDSCMFRIHHTIYLSKKEC